MLVVLLAVAAFGETALRSEEPSNVSVRALRFCETSVLLREDWEVIEAINPQIRLWLDIYIMERDRKLMDKQVQIQSQQTKAATIRCGGSYKEWTEMGVMFQQKRPTPIASAWQAARKVFAIDRITPSKDGRSVATRARLTVEAACSAFLSVGPSREQSTNDARA